jgi:2-(1,2-epoxy-1,2-dihydrophenyl)acetyl-CoA isomerase
MNYESLLLEKKDSIATITLNAPEKLNAISTKMKASLLSAMEEVNKDDSVKVVILTGAGRGFCAGHDISGDFGTAKEELSLSQRMGLASNEASFYKLDKPAIAAINGACVGAGLSLALSCDIRIASETAKFGSAYIKLGASPGLGLGYLLPRIIGPAAALEFLFTGKVILGAEAKELGIVSRVVPGQDLMKVSQELAADIAQYPLIALGLTKRLVYRSMIEGITYQYDLENWAGLITKQTRDNREAMNAFNEKRDVLYKGK